MNGKPVKDLAWIGALIRVREGDMSPLAELLENEAFEFGMKQRRKLAEELTAPKKVGRKGNVSRDLDLYRDVLSHKLWNGIKKLPEKELLRIAEPYGLRATDTIKTALKNGKRISRMLAEIDAENNRDDEGD